MTSPFERPGPGRLPPLRPSVRRAVLWILAALFVALILIPWLASFATDWLWYKEIGFQSVFARSVSWRIGLFLLGSAFAYGYFYGNVRIARGSGAAFPVLYINRGDGVNVDVSRFFTRLFRPVAFVLAFVVGIAASASWLDVLKAFNGVALGARDSLFGRDISFYLFKLPFISGVLGTLVTLTLLSLVATAVMYWIRNDIIV